MIHLNPELKVVGDGKLESPRYLRLKKAVYACSKPKTIGWIPPATREYITSRSSVAGLVYCPGEKKVLMLRQFRYPVYHDTRDPHLSWIYESVAGLIDSDDSPEQTFIREVKEETGIEIGSDTTTFHCSYYVSPGFVNEQHFVFTATVDTCEEPDIDPGLDNEGEAIIAEWQTYEEIRELVKGVSDKDGNFHKIVDGKTLMSLINIGLA